MKKKAKINENSHKKKYYKIHQGKSQLIDRPYHNNPNIEEHKVNNIEKYNKNYIEQKRIYSIENNKDKKENTFNFYNPDKFVNGLVNDDIENINYSKIYKTIYNQKKSRKFFREKYYNRNDNLAFKNSNNQNERIMDYDFESDNVNNDNDIMVDLKSNIYDQNQNEENSSFFGESNKLSSNNYIPEDFFKLKKYEKDKAEIQNNIICNNLNDNISNISPLSPKLFFDYKRISNLLINSDSIEADTKNKANNNLFRKRKIKIGVNNTNDNLYTPLSYKQKPGQKVLCKKASFNDNKKLINNDDNTDDIPISHIKKYEITNNFSSIPLSNYNNSSNIIERNYDLFFSPKDSSNQINKYSYYNPSNKPSFKTTENKNFFLESKYSNNCKKMNNTINVNKRKNRNFNITNGMEFNTTLKNKKYNSALNVFNAKEKKESINDDNNDNVLTGKSANNIRKKRKIFRKKNYSFNNFWNNNRIKLDKLSNKKDLNDDISIYRKQSKNNNNKEKGGKNKVTSDYYSNYFQKENNKKRKIFCFNKCENNNDNNNNKIKEKKLINNSPDNSMSNNSNIDYKKINYIINKYKNNSVINARNSDNKKIKNLIFTYERMFKQDTSIFNEKVEKNSDKFWNNVGNKDDINYKKDKNKKIKVRYLTPNTTKNNNQINYELDSEKINNQKDEYNSKGKTEIENNNITSSNEKNLEFGLNITQSKSILKNMQYENKNSNNSFKKVKDFLKNEFPIKEENKSNKKRIFKLISNTDKNKSQYIFRNSKNNYLGQAFNDYNNYEISNTIDSSDYTNNAPYNLKNYNKISDDNNYNKYNRMEEYSYSNKENSENNLNLDMNNAYFKEVKKPIIINSQSCIYDNYGHNKYKDKYRKINRENDFIFNNKTINNCNNCSKRYRQILGNENQNKEHRNMKRKYKCKCGKENNYNIEGKNIDSEKLLLITDITKCPKCHCLFGKSSKIL